MLSNILNKGDKPPVIADKIKVAELVTRWSLIVSLAQFATLQPPELEIRDSIGELVSWNIQIHIQRRY